MKQIHVKKIWQLLTSTRFDTALFAVVATLLLVVLLQVAYPSDRTLPLARISGTSLGSMLREEAIDQLRQTFGSVPLEVKIPGAEPFKTTTVKAGLTPQYQASVNRAADYSLAERLIPFSIVFKSLVSMKGELPHVIEKERFSSFAQAVASACQRPAKDAKVVFEDGRVSLQPAVNGQKCTEAAALKALQEVELQSESATVTLRPEAVQPERSTEEMRSTFNDAEKAVSEGLVIASERERWEVPKEVIASWLTVEESADSASLAIKPQEVQNYLQTIRGKLYIAPGTIEIRTVDGREVSRTAAVSGQGIDTDVTTARIRAVLLGESQTNVAWVQLTTIPPVQKVVRTYTASHAGMQALIEQWDREFSARYGVVVRDLSGRGISASLHPNRDFVTASTFKMFLAYAVLHKVEEGDVAMDTRTDIGLSVRACIDEMIVNSTNECALSLFRLVGWDYAHSFIRGQFPSTSLKNSASPDNEKHTTPLDEADFMTRLHNGELMNAENTNYLLGLMKRQVWRSGIPKGVSGTTVANKVGFYNGYKHDTAIVYGPRGAYVLTVLTYGGNDSQIAELARRVHALMNQ